MLSAAKYLLLLSGLSLSAHAQGNFLVKVEAVRAPAYSKDPQSIRWKEIKAGEILSDNILLQLLPKGAVKLSYKRSEGKKERDYQLTLTEPVVLRITPRMLRKIELSEVYLKNLNKESNKKKQKVETLPLQTAWKRISAIYDRMIANISSIFGKEGAFDQGNRVAQKVKRIKFITPIDNQSIVVDDMPSQVTIAWHPAKKAKDKQPEYEIFFWPIDLEKPKRGQRTKSTQYTLDIKKVGRYFLKVQTLDETHHSRAQLLNVVSKFELFSKKNDGAEEAKGSTSITENRLIQSRYPADQTEIFTKSKSPEVSFSWFRFSSAENYDVVIEGANLLKITAGKNNFVTTKLPHATYKWWVEAMLKGKVIKSAPRQLIIRGKSQTLTQLIDNLPLRGQQVLFWEEN